MKELGTFLLFSLDLWSFSSSASIYISHYPSDFCRPGGSSWAYILYVPSTNYILRPPSSVIVVLVGCQNWMDIGCDVIVVLLSGLIVSLDRVVVGPMSLWPYSLVRW